MLWRRPLAYRMEVVMEELLNKKTILVILAAFFVGFLLGRLGEGVKVINMNGSSNSKMIIGNDNGTKK